MPDDKTRGQGFSRIIKQKLEAGKLEIILQVEISENGNTTVTVFKGSKKIEPKKTDAVSGHAEIPKDELPENAN